MKIIHPLLLGLTLAMASQVATAQETFSGDPGDLPPAVGLGDEGGVPAPPTGDLDEGVLEPIPAGEELDGFDGSILGEPMQLLEKCSPYFESSGTWLQRGFWYTEVDYVAFNRGWDRKGVILANEEQVAMLVEELRHAHRVGSERNDGLLGRTIHLPGPQSRSRHPLAGDG